MSNNRVPVLYEPIKEPLKVGYRKRIQEEKEAENLIDEYLKQKEYQDYIDRHTEI